MNNTAILQEVFDAMATLSAGEILLYYEMEEVVRNNLEGIKKHGLHNKVFEDYSKVAEKYGLKYTHPKFAMGLTSADQPRQTIH